VDILAGIFAAALLQDLAYKSKTALVSRGHRRLAVAADVSAMLTSSLYLTLAASETGIATTRLLAIARTKSWVDTCSTRIAIHSCSSSFAAPSLMRWAMVSLSR
jgi:hypothetical protein